ncbi:MAG: biotin synthase BioB [Coprobacillus sp.]
MKDIVNYIIKQGMIDKKMAMSLLCEDLDELCFYANEIRKHFCQNKFDVCSIVNGKSGTCSENCRFCSQSSFYQTLSDKYPLMSLEDIKKEANYNALKGVQRFSIVTSGKKLSQKETHDICEIYKDLKENVSIGLCASCGLLDLKQLKQLKESGVQRYHNNLETSKGFFSQICTSHTYEDKINTLKQAKEAGLDICSGGIMGMGESFEDRIDLAFQLRDLGVASIPINFLNPIKGTPLENQRPLTLEEAKRVIAIFRFILPNAFIRLAGGRQLFENQGACLFECGANATITGDMLTTNGISIDEDMNMIERQGYEVIAYE